MRGDPELAACLWEPLCLCAFCGVGERGFLGGGYPSKGWGLSPLLGWFYPLKGGFITRHPPQIGDKITRGQGGYPPFGGGFSVTT